MARILLVDDDPAVTNVMRLFLEAAGHQVNVANGVHAGKTAIEHGTHELYVFDLNMPDGRGFDLIRFVRETLQRKTPVLVLSGQKQEASVLQALELGADDFVRKPFSPREVVARIGRMVSR